MISKALLGIVLVAAVGPVFAGDSLDLSQRVSAQAAIEEVYWKHRIWPSDNPGPKPSLAQVLPESVLRARVADYLEESDALERLWSRPIQDEDLQAEVERMAASSRAPLVLQEIFAALGNNPGIIKECLARPLLADRLIRHAYARDPRYHSGLKGAIRQVLARHPSISEANQLGAEYAEAVWVQDGRQPDRAERSRGRRVVRLDHDSWNRKVAELPVGTLGELQEDDESFFVQAVLDKGADRLTVATAAWRKRPFDDWWAEAKTTQARLSTREARTERDDSGIAPSLPSVVAAECSPDTWSPVSGAGAPSPREAHTAVWTGTEMIVWGGFNQNGYVDTNSGGRYTPATNSWVATTTTAAPAARDTHTAVWTGTKMVVWGGGNELYVPKDSGGRYDPTTNIWSATTTFSAPTARLYHTAVWSGSKMIVWGGSSGTADLDTGGRYDPASDSWATTIKQFAPSSRDQHIAIWTGSTMVVWGGTDDNAVAQNTGGRYDPVGNSWSPTNTTGAPSARWGQTAVWTGSRLIVWGGFDGNSVVDSGGRYDPAGDTWTSMSTTGAPAPRDQHVAVWSSSGSAMQVWGGQNVNAAQLNTGGRYNPTTNVWAPMSSAAAPIARRYHTGIWSGSEFVVWGGWNVTDLNSGGRYCPGACSAPPPTAAPTATLSKQPGGAQVSWTAVSGATAYDVVRGGLNVLLDSGGNFASAMQSCLANDQAATSALDAGTPPLNGGFWYLIRGLNCGGVGSYSDTGGVPTDTRDTGIAASVSACP
jgi:N-acetylneuraminic acid mutarotase